MPCDCLQDLTCMIATFLMDDWEIEDDDDEQNSWNDVFDLLLLLVVSTLN